MSKQPTGLAYVGNFVNYLLYLPAPFPRGLEIDLERSSIFLLLKLLMHINGLGLVSKFYGSLFIFITVCLGSWASATVLCIAVGWCCTIAVPAWCSVHQLPGCEFAVKGSCAPLRKLNAACIYVYMAIYSHIYMHLNVYTM